ncbi:MAG: outer membrane lipoprotein LolB [Methylotenera sp.]|nr:MAG: outer membrane lipoprotein LolB [Methylotenera sp.]
MRALFLAALVAVIAGCASSPISKPIETPASKSLQQQHLNSIAAIKAFSLKGRIGVQTEGKGFSGSMQWQHETAEDNIALYSPLGGQVASIKKDANAVTLTEGNGNSISAQDAETLTEMTLGWKLPLTGLADWSLGRPTAQPIDKINWDEMGRITHLVQEGWDIEYSDYLAHEGKQLPNKIYLRSPKVNIKLIVENRFSTP